MEYLPQRSPSSDFGENQLSRGLISLSLLLSSHLRIFQHPRVRSSTACYRSFNLLKSRSPPLRVYCPRLVFAHFALGFPSPPVHQDLRLATDNNSQTHYAKGKQSPGPFYGRPYFPFLSSVPWDECDGWDLGRQPQNGPGSYTLYAIGCRSYFTPLAGVLFTFPSRYLFTIGCQGVFSLIRWSGQIHAEFHVHRITWDSSRGLQVFAYPAVTVYGRLFQIVLLTLHLPH